MWKINRPNSDEILKNERIRSALKNYFGVMSDQRLSISKAASMIEADGSGDIDALWSEHESTRKEFQDLYREILERSSFGKSFFNKNPKDLSPGPKGISTQRNINFTINKKPSFSYLDLKVMIAEKLLEDCVLCENLCHVDRRSERGVCGVGSARVASEFMHMGEESQLVPSHTIFFTGCSFKCVYCQNWDISQHPGGGMSIPEEEIAAIIDKRRRQGSRNVNFVGGEPTPNLPYILKTMKLTQENIPVVWNSNFYMSEESMKLLDGFADLFLTDFKYGNDDCALRLSGIKNYWKTVTRNHKMAWNAGDMIIRHLVLPNHVECCSKPILRWISRNIGLNVVLNIMDQYRPVYMALEHEDISRFPSTREFQDVYDYAEDLGFVNLV